MTKYRAWAQLAVVILVVWYLVSLVKSCQADPTQTQLFSQLEIMRGDMQEITNAGGRVINYDNNSKTTFARDYLLLSIDPATWNEDLQKAYVNTLLTRGWIPVKGDDDKFSFCKGGASALVGAPTANRNGFVDMIFDSSTISACKKKLSINTGTH